MKIPDLAAELAYWREKLNLRDWKIAVRWVDNPIDPDTGDPVWGLCERVPYNRTAAIQVRRPVKDADIAEAHDTIVHELLHCLLAAMEAPRVVEENAVWTLAPLLTELRTSDPRKAVSLAKAMTRPRVSLVATKARAGGTMNPEDIAKLAMQAGEMIATENLPEPVKALMQALIAAAAGAPADAAPESVETPVDPAAPPMGMQKEGDKDKSEPPPMKVGDPMAKRMAELEAKAAEDRAAAVDGLLDARADIKGEARAMLRTMGLEKGAATLRKALVDLVPVPKQEPATEPQKPMAKLGVGAVPRGGTGGRAAIAPSGEKSMNRMFRVFEGSPDSTGVDVPDASTGKLVTFSVADALPRVRKAMMGRVNEAKLKMMGGAK